MPLVRADLHRAHCGAGDVVTPGQRIDRSLLALTQLVALQATPGPGLEMSGQDDVEVARQIPTITGKEAVWLWQQRGCEAAGETCTTPA